MVIVWSLYRLILIPMILHIIAKLFAFIHQKYMELVKNVQPTCSALFRHLLHDNFDLTFFSHRHRLKILIKDITFVLNYT